MLIVAGSPSVHLAEKTAAQLKVPYISTQFKKFPDGEKYVRVNGDVKGQDVVLIQSTALKPDEYLIEYFLLADALKDLGAKRIRAVFPYFAYARQDERFTLGEAISFQTVVKLIEAVGTSEIYTIDSHRHRIPDLAKVFRIRSHELTAMHALANYIKERFTLSDPIVIGPDSESEPWVRTVASELGTSYDVMEKKRLGPDKVEIKPLSLNVKGHDIVITDDIISTGGTVIEATKILLGAGARRILVACAHPILAENALEKISAAGVEDVVGTDSVQSPVSRVSVAPIIAEALRK